MLARAAGCQHVAAGFLVDREKPHRRAVLGSHVGHGGPIGHRERRGAVAEEFDELADDLRLAQHLGHDENQIRRRDSLGELPRQVHTHDVRRQKVDGLAEHPGLGFDAADAPGHDAEAVDHGGVRVGADERVGIEDAVLREHPLRQVFEIDLVHDADPRRHDLEPVECLHAPLEKLVAGPVAAELDLHVGLEGVGSRPLVDLDGVVDDEGDRHQGLDDPGVLSEPLDRRPHGGQIHEQRHPGEVLENDAGHDERDLGRALGLRLPGGQRPDVVFLDSLAVAVAQEGFDDDAQADREAGNRTDPVLFELRQGVEGAGPAVAEGKGQLRAGELAHRRYRITPSGCC